MEFIITLLKIIGYGIAYSMAIISICFALIFSIFLWGKFHEEYFKNENMKETENDEFD